MAEIVTGVVAAFAAITDGEFVELTAADSGTTVITITAGTAGKPFTQTSSATGLGALVTVTTTANLSKSDVNDADNWSAGTILAAGEDIYIDDTAVSLLHNLDAHAAVTVASMSVFSSFTGTAGLPETNVDGTAYREYRPTYFECGVTLFNMGDFTGGQGSGRFKWDGKAVLSTINVYSTGATANPGLPAFIWKGTNASNVVRVEGGSFGAAIFGGEVATILTLTVVGGDVLCGPGCTLTTINLSGGDLDTASAVGGTATVDGGTWTHRAGNITTLTLNNGKLELRNGAALTITTTIIGPEGVLDLTNAIGAVTMTTVTIRPGGTILDPNNRLASTLTYTAQGGPNSVNVIRGAASATVALS